MGKLTIIFFILITPLFIYPIGGDGDFYHHIHTGKYVLENFKLPKVDEWTFTEYGKPWVAHSWAAGISFYLIYQFFGLTGISLFVALMGFLTIFLIYLLLKTYQLKLAIIFPLLILLTSLAIIRFPARPEIFAYPLIISILLIDKLSTKSINLYLFYPLIIFLWSVFYGANVIVGLLLLIFLTIAHYARKARHYEAKPILFVLLAILVSLFNGYGLDTILYILKIPNISQIQGEWLGILPLVTAAPLQYLDVARFRVAVYSLLILLYLSLLLTHLKLIRNYLWQFMLSLAIFLPFLSFRQALLGTILTLPFLASLLGNYPSRLKLTVLWSLATVTLFLTLIFNFPKLEFSEDPARIKLISFIAENNLSGNAYTSQQIGSYLSFKLHPKILVSYDTRDDLFMGGKFLKMELSGAPLELILTRYKADFVVLDLGEDSQRVNYILHSPKWIKLYDEGSFLVMTRR